MMQVLSHFELLTPVEMNEADKITVKEMSSSSFLLMQRAGQAVSEVVIKNYSHIKSIAVLCGPGNNGGDGYIAAESLRQSGYHVICYTLNKPKLNSDADKALQSWAGITKDIHDFQSGDYDLIIDAIFGAGLNRPLSLFLSHIIHDINQNKKIVISVDLPSGVSGQTGEIMGNAFQADCTITFFRYKLGHWLYPGRQCCGKLILADIGIREDILQKIKPSISLNIPLFWHENWPHLDIHTHKYSRGHVAVFSGPASMTGASRLSAKAAQRMGAGAVTLLSPKESLFINAQHLTSIMLHHIKSNADIVKFMNVRKVKAVVLGPGFGDMQKAYNYAKILMKETTLLGLVLDADALTAFQNNKAKELAILSDQSNVPIVVTPHEGEFERLFPDFADNKALSRLEKAKSAAKILNAVVVYKGADTIIASPDGRISINVNGTPLLATAGSGDVLAGFIAGLIAQEMPVYEASCAAVWLHAACAQQYGVGLIAEDLPEILPKVLTDLFDNNNIF